MHVCSHCHRCPKRCHCEHKRERWEIQYDGNPNAPRRFWCKTPRLVFVGLCRSSFVQRASRKKKKPSQVAFCKSCFIAEIAVPQVSALSAWRESHSYFKENPPKVIVYSRFLHALLDYAVAARSFFLPWLPLTDQLVHDVLDILPIGGAVVGRWRIGGEGELTPFCSARSH